MEAAKSKRQKDWKNPTWQNARKSWYATGILCFVLPAVVLLCMEWVARGTLAANGSNSGFVQAIVLHFPSFLVAYLFLVAIYVLLLALTATHLVPAVVVQLIGFLPAVATYYKLTMRGEPFLPWDLSQLEELFAISGNLSLDIQANMVITLLLFIVLAVLAAFIKPPYKRDLPARLFLAAAGLGCVLLLLFGIFLSPKGSASIGIREDSWMQDRYYRNHGVITGFLTNLQLLDIDKPDSYNQQTVEEVLAETQQMAQSREPLFKGSYAATTENAVQQPNIIYIMAESFWDVTALEGIVYDQEILPNLTALMQEGAYGYAYSPSFGGGTCDVEFEALTGFSMEYLPSGAKPYQQYVTHEIASLPNYLRQQGYTNIAIHGYGAKFWSRETAYPKLGFDEFISSTDFVNPIYRRGFISDESMVDRILEELHSNSDTPVFIHAVTMQNHTTYSRDRYPEHELVNVLSALEGISDSVIGQLEDCATGMRDMDAALGKLVAALKESDEPTIVVFWGDHLNPMSDGYSLFEQTGFIEKGDTASPNLHMTPLLIWSNYDDATIDLGVVATYNLTPVMMDLYGLEMPLYFEFLAQQTEVLRGKTRGVVIEPDNSFAYELNDEQRASFEKQAVLQYDLLFGQEYILAYTQ